MICPNCQKEIPDIARACGYCGYWLAGEQKLTDKTPQEVTVKKGLLWLWLGLGVAAVAVIGITAYLFSSGSGRVDTEATIAAAVVATQQARATQSPTNTPPEPTNTSKPINSLKLTPVPDTMQVVYLADLSNKSHWPQRSDVMVSDGKLTFTPKEFEEVWATDFSQELGDFTLSATFSYDTQSRDDVGVAIVVGDSSTGNFFFLGPNPNNGNTLWYFVMVKNWEHIHPSTDSPMTTGQPEQFAVQLERLGKQVSVYVNGEKIITREDIIFKGKTARMQIGVHADGDDVSISLHGLSVLVPTTNITNAAPTLYDNFDAPAFDGKWNNELWDLWPNAPIYEVAQHEGSLMVAQQKGADTNTEMAARQYLDFTLKSPTFFEAKLKLAPDKFNGNIHLHLNATLPSEKGWFSQCIIYGDSDQPGANCWDTAWPQQEKHDYSSESQPVALDTWHTFRIEVDPTTMRFTYYIDGQEVGSHVPVDAEALKKAKFTLIVGVWALTADPLTGYVDDVRVGPIDGQTWEFEKNDDPKGWIAENQLDPLKVNNGILKTRSTGNDPYLVSPKFSLNAASSAIVEIRMKVSEARSTGQFFFLTDADEKKNTWFSEDQKFEFPVKGDGQFHTYTLDMSTIKEWTGVIKQIRLDPTEDIPAAIEIDYIRLKAQ